MDKIKDLLYEFTCNNKRQYIGGCKKIYITIQHKVLILSWIPYIFENIDFFCVQCLQANLHFLIEHILLGNLNKKDMEKCRCNCINMFCYEMLLHWSTLIFKDNISTLQDVVNQLLWINCHTKYNKTVLYPPSLYSRRHNADFRYT